MRICLMASLVFMESHSRMTEPFLALRFFTPFLLVEEEEEDNELF